VLDSFSKINNCEDGNSDLIEAIKQLKLNAKLEDVLLTLIALFILQEKFDDREDEWTLLAKKAKAWLKQVGVAKPD
jgi:hypothetical protein